MSVLGTALTSLNPQELAELVTKYAPAIEALIRFLELHKDEAARAESMDLITTGLHYAAQTGDTSQAEAALRDHCVGSSLGCRVQ